MSSAIEPEDVDVSLTEGMTIRWQDGHSSHYTVVELRMSCPCATCDDKRQKEKAAQAANPAPPLLPILHRTASRIGRVSPVGRYALNFIFDDGHSTGIFTWDYLREICPCLECCRRRASGLDGHEVAPEVREHP